VVTYNQYNRLLEVQQSDILLCVPDSGKSHDSTKRLTATQQQQQIYCSDQKIICHFYAIQRRIIESLLQYGNRIPKEANHKTIIHILPHFIYVQAPIGRNKGSKDYINAAKTRKIKNWNRMMIPWKALSLFDLSPVYSIYKISCALLLFKKKVS
jgi:hypothetical protein